MLPPTHLRPGYLTIEAARKLKTDAPEWQTFMRDVVGLPPELLPWVQRAIRERHWTRARDPLESVRRVAELAAKRAQDRASSSKEEGKG